MRSTWTSGKAPNAGRNWSACVSSRYVRVACMSADRAVAGSERAIYFTGHDLQQNGDPPPPARVPSPELHGARPVLYLRRDAQLDRPGEDPARREVSRRGRGEP